MTGFLSLQLANRLVQQTKIDVAVTRIVLAKSDFVVLLERETLLKLHSEVWSTRKHAFLSLLST